MPTPRTSPAAEFEHALVQWRSIPVRPEIDVTEAPAPQRLAPHAAALTAEVVVEDHDAASGRLVVLFDPDGQDAWEGRWRIVAFARAELEPEMAGDPAVCDVGWAWLEEALADHETQVTAQGGTVTRTHSQPYGALVGRDITGELELRASWTPLDDDLTGHVRAWLQVLASMVGLEPEVDGVTRLRP